MFQSTLDGGSALSAQACSHKKYVPMKSVIREGRRKPSTQGLSTQSQKNKDSSSQSQKKMKIQDEIPDVDDELEEDEFDEDEYSSQDRENKQNSDVWVDIKVVVKPSGYIKTV